MMLEINKIHLGDSYELIKQIPDKSIDCIYTDIPYLYNISEGGGNPEGKSALSKRITKVMCNDLQGITDGIDYKILYDFIRVMKKINCFIWCSRLQVLDILSFFNQAGCNFDMLVWCKDNPTPQTNNVWLPDLEYCLYFREKGVRLNDGYKLKSKWYASPINKRDKDTYEHPSIKPLQFVKRHILHATQPNDIIFDPFAGSGTTAVAAMETGRQFVAIEKEKRWYDIAVDRINGITASGQYTMFREAL